MKNDFLHSDSVFFGLYLRDFAGAPKKISSQNLSVFYQRISQFLCRSSLRNLFSCRLSGPDSPKKSSSLLCTSSGGLKLYFCTHFWKNLLQGTVFKTENHRNDHDSFRHSHLRNLVLFSCNFLCFALLLKYG